MKNNKLENLLVEWYHKHKDIDLPRNHKSGEEVKNLFIKQLTAQPLINEIKHLYNSMHVYCRFVDNYHFEESPLFHFLQTEYDPLVKRILYGVNSDGTRHG